MPHLVQSLRTVQLVVVIVRTDAAQVLITASNVEVRTGFAWWCSYGKRMGHHCSFSTMLAGANFAPQCVHILLVIIHGGVLH